ncbi:MAG: EamA family transporter [Deltaproteobacteria bacterium]|nr:EamA family transporter [Deltaproteobacteria bacterium]
MGAVIFWGLSFVATKIALTSIPTFTLIFARFSISALFFLTLILRNGLPRFSKKDHIFLFLLSLFEPGLYFIFETLGLQYTTAPKASLIIATIPIAVLILSTIFLKEKSSPARLASIVLSFAGIFILITGESGFRLSWEGSVIGDLLIFGAVISAALYIVSARNLGRRYSALEITSMQVFYGSLFYAPAFLWELPAIEWSQISGSSLGAVVYLTVFATIGAFLCYNFALTRISATRASLFINLIPVVTAIGAWILLNETLTMIQAFGGLLVLFSVFIASLPGLRAKTPEHILSK